MLPLPDLQAAFTGGIFGECISNAIAPGRFAPDQHLQIYRNNIFQSLTGALKAVYPVIERLVGDGFFRFAADGYIRRHPPRSGNLHDFGIHYADFLTGFAPAASLSYLPDVARLEWAWHEAFHAADAPALDARCFAEIPAQRQARLRLCLHPSARLLSSAYPLLRIWQANQDGAAEQDINLAEGGVQLMVIRRELQVQIETLSLGELVLLRALAQGETLEFACEAAFASDTAFDLTATLQRVVHSGVLISLREDT